MALPLRRRPLGKTEHREAEALAGGLSRVNWEVRYEYEDGARGGKAITQDPPDVVVISGKSLNNLEPRVNVFLRVSLREEHARLVAEDEKRGRASRHSSMHNALQDVFSPFPVDLVFLQETHSVFQANAICGRCVYSSSSQFKEDYEEDILRRAADFRPFLERYLDEVLEEAQTCPSTRCS